MTSYPPINLTTAYIEGLSKSNPTDVRRHYDTLVKGPHLQLHSSGKKEFGFIWGGGTSGSKRSLGFVPDLSLNEARALACQVATEPAPLPSKRNRVEDLVAAMKRIGEPCLVSRLVEELDWTGCSVHGHLRTLKSEGKITHENHLYALVQPPETPVVAPPQSPERLAAFLYDLMINRLPIGDLLASAGYSDVQAARILSGSIDLDDIAMTLATDLLDSSKQILALDEQSELVINS